MDVADVRIRPVDEGDGERLHPDRSDLRRRVNPPGAEEMEVVLGGAVVDGEREHPWIEMGRPRPGSVVDEDREVRPYDRVQLVARRAGDAGEDETRREESDEEAAQRHLTWCYAGRRRSDCSHRLTTQLGAEAIDERTDDASADNGRVVIRQRAVGCLQREVDGD